MALMLNLITDHHLIIINGITFPPKAILIHIQIKRDIQTLIILQIKTHGIHLGMIHIIGLIHLKADLSKTTIQIIKENLEAEHSNLGNSEYIFLTLIGLFAGLIRYFLRLKPGPMVHRPEGSGVSPVHGK